MMSEYSSELGPIPGTILWRVTATGTEHRVLPDAVMDIIVNDDALVFAGPDTTADLMTVTPGAVTWGLRLSPGMALALLGVAADELVNQRVRLTDLVGVPSSSIDAAHVNPRAGLEQIARDLWQRSEPDVRQLRLAQSLDHAAHMGFGVRQIADHHGMSERTLRRLSHQLFGYGPKALMAIHRFQRALDLARSGVSLGEAAVLANYSDQAHLSREARRLGGATIVELLEK